MEEEQEERKGLWAQMMESNKHTVVYDPGEWTLEKMNTALIETQKRDVEWRARMDKEYTDIGKLTPEDIESIKSTHHMPGTFAKVKICGKYCDVPIGYLKLYIEALDNEVNKWKDVTTKNSNAEIPKTTQEKANQEEETK